MQFTYLLINFSIIIFPLLLSFERRIRYISRMKSYLFSILTVSTVFIIWDHIAVKRGDWFFNSRFITGLEIFSLPIEELLFFITVPYSCLFVYQVIAHFIPERRICLNQIYHIILLLLSLVFIINFKRYYTATVSAFSLTALVISLLFFRQVLMSFRYVIFIGTGFMLFFIFNLILTSLPVVLYSENSITGLRIISIPIEDFLYNFALLTLYLVMFIYWENRNKTHLV